MSGFQSNWRLGERPDMWMSSCETWIHDETEGYEAFQPVYMIDSDVLHILRKLVGNMCNYSLILYMKFISKCFESVTF